ERILTGGANEERAAAIVQLERKVRGRLHRLAHVPVAGVRCQTHDLIPASLTLIRNDLECFTDGTLPYEVWVGEGLVDNRGAGQGIARAKVPAFEQWNLHPFQPARRDAQKIRRDRTGRRSAYGNEPVPTLSGHQWPLGDCHGLDALQ